MPQTADRLLTVILRKGESHTLLLWWLTHHRLLTVDHINTLELLKHLPYLFLVNYWAHRSTVHLLALQSHFSSLPYRSLPLWLCLVLCRDSPHPPHHEYWLRVVHFGRWLALSQPMIQSSPQYMAILNALLTQHPQHQAGNFLMVSLQQLPYLKELYLLALKQLPH